MKRSPLFLRVSWAVVLFTLTSIHAASAATPIWSDEFAQAEGSAPDPAKWRYDLGGSGWGNHELEIYTDSRANSSVVADSAATDGKALAIVARKDSAGIYTSARLKTQGKFSLTYGRIEARLKTTNGKGLWPAFWMLGNSISTVGWPRSGEIDIMEVIGRDPVAVAGTLHGPGYSGDKGIGKHAELADGSLLSDRYHVYAVDWSPDKIVWSFDSTPYHTMTPALIPPGTKWVFNDVPFFLLLNLAVGGGYPGNPDSSTTFPQTYTIDYVRVYSLTPATTR